MFCYYGFTVIIRVILYLYFTHAGMRGDYVKHRAVRRRDLTASDFGVRGAYTSETPRRDSQTRPCAGPSLMRLTILAAMSAAKSKYALEVWSLSLRLRVYSAAGAAHPRSLAIQTENRTSGLPRSRLFLFARRTAATGSDSATEEGRRSRMCPSTNCNGGGRCVSCVCTH